MKNGVFLFLVVVVVVDAVVVLCVCVCCRRTCSMRCSRRCEHMHSPLTILQNTLITHYTLDWSARHSYFAGIAKHISMDTVLKYNFDDVAKNRHHQSIRGYWGRATTFSVLCNNTIAQHSAHFSPTRTNTHTRFIRRDSIRRADFADECTRTRASVCVERSRLFLRARESNTPKERMII